MVALIEDHREEYGVEPTCQLLPIAPSTYHAYKAREADLRLTYERAQRDEWLRAEIRRVCKVSFKLYGARKVWRQLNVKESSWRAVRCRA